VAELRTIIEKLSEAATWDDGESLDAILARLTSEQLQLEAQLTLRISERGPHPSILRALVFQSGQPLFQLARRLPASISHYEIERVVLAWQAAGEKVEVTPLRFTHLVVGRISPGARRLLEEDHCSIEIINREPSLYLVTITYRGYCRDYFGGEDDDVELIGDELHLRLSAIELFYERRPLDVSLHSLRAFGEPVDVFDHPEEE
jgi:hypothetical protein